MMARLLELAIKTFLFMLCFGMICGQFTPSFVPGTSSTVEGADGILQVQISTNPLIVGTVCNYNFGTLEASVACYQMGFAAVGLAIVLDGPRVTSLPVVMSDVNCTSRVNSSDLNTYNLSSCYKRAGINNVPDDCGAHTKDVRVLCYSQRATTSGPSTTTTVRPPTTVSPSVNCTGISSTFRLTGGTSTAGRLEYFNNGAWGTVCVEGMDVNAARAICSGLCNNPILARQYAKVVSTYATTNTNLPILLNGITCPVGSTNWSNCTSSAGNPYGCSHSQDAGLICGPVSTTVIQAPTPTVVCSIQAATVYFDNVNSYAFINASAITLVGGTPAGCNFVVTSNATYTIASIPLTGCNQNVQTNDSHNIITSTLNRRVFENADGSLTRSSYTVTVTCIIPRNHSAQGDTLTGGPVGGPNVVGMARDSLNLSIFTDNTYTTMMPSPAYFAVQAQVCASTYLVDSLSTASFILQRCWATSTPSGLTTPSIPIIDNKCAVLSGTVIEFFSMSEVRFCFPMFQISGAQTSGQQIYIHCSGITCDTRTPDIRTPSCFRSCASSGKRRRRSVDDELPFEEEERGAILETIQDNENSIIHFGPIQPIPANVGLDAENGSSQVSWSALNVLLAPVTVATFMFLLSQLRE